MKMIRVLLAGCLLLVTLFGCSNVKQTAATEDAGVSQAEREAYYIHLNGWSSIKTQFSALLSPLKTNAASKQKTLQTAAKIAV